MIKEIFEKDYLDNKEILFVYKSKKYFDIVKKLSINEGWTFELKIKEFDQPFEKKLIENLFQPYKENTRYFAYLNQNGHEIGIMSVGHQTWNNVTRIWDLYVQASFQNLGVGTELIKHAENVAKENKSRALVLECQSSNYPAIRFYMKNGFSLTGFDLINYSNVDLQRHEVRLEMSKLID